MKKVLLVALVLVLSFIAISCAFDPYPAISGTSDVYYDECPGGVVVKMVPSEQKSLTRDNAFLYIFVLEPKQSECSLPKQYCFAFTSGVRGSMVCTVID